MASAASPSISTSLQKKASAPCPMLSSSLPEKSSVASPKLPTSLPEMASTPCPTLFTSPQVKAFATSQTLPISPLEESAPLSSTLPEKTSTPSPKLSGTLTEKATAASKTLPTSFPVKEFAHSPTTSTPLLEKASTPSPTLSRSLPENASVARPTPPTSSPEKDSAHSPTISTSLLENISTPSPTLPSSEKASTPFSEIPSSLPENVFTSSPNLPTSSPEKASAPSPALSTLPPEKAFVATPTPSTYLPEKVLGSCPTLPTSLPEKMFALSPTTSTSLPEKDSAPSPTLPTSQPQNTSAPSPTLQANLPEKASAPSQTLPTSLPEKAPPPNPTLPTTLSEKVSVPFQTPSISIPEKDSLPCPTLATSFSKKASASSPMLSSFLPENASTGSPTIPTSPPEKDVAPSSTQPISLLQKVSAPSPTLPTSSSEKTFSSSPTLPTSPPENISVPSPTQPISSPEMASAASPSISTSLPEKASVARPKLPTSLPEMASTPCPTLFTSPQVKAFATSQTLPTNQPEKAMGPTTTLPTNPPEKASAPRPTLPTSLPEKASVLIPKPSMSLPEKNSVPCPTTSTSFLENVYIPSPTLSSSLPENASVASPAPPTSSPENDSAHSPTTSTSLLENISTSSPNLSSSEKAFTPCSEISSSPPDNAFTSSPTLPTFSPEKASAPSPALSTSPPEKVFVPTPTPSTSLPEKVSVTRPTLPISAPEKISEPSPTTSTSLPEKDSAPSPTLQATSPEKASAPSQTLPTSLPEKAPPLSPTLTTFLSDNSSLPGPTLPTSLSEKASKPSPTLPTSLSEKVSILIQTPSISIPEKDSVPCPTLASSFSEKASANSPVLSSFLTENASAASPIHPTSPPEKDLAPSATASIALLQKSSAPSPTLPTSWPENTFSSSPTLPTSPPENIPVSSPTQPLSSPEMASAASQSISISLLKKASAPCPMLSSSLPEKASVASPKLPTSLPEMAFAPCPTLCTSPQVKAFATSQTLPANQPEKAMAPTTTLPTNPSEKASAPSETLPTSLPGKASVPIPKPSISLPEQDSVPCPTTSTSFLEMASIPSPTLTSSAPENISAHSPTTSTSLPEKYSAPCPTLPATPPEKASAPSQTPPTSLPEKAPPPSPTLKTFLSENSSVPGPTLPTSLSEKAFKPSPKLPNSPPENASVPIQTPSISIPEKGSAPCPTRATSLSEKASRPPTSTVLLETSSPSLTTSDSFLMEKYSLPIPTLTSLSGSVVLQKKASVPSPTSTTSLMEKTFVPGQTLPTSPQGKVSEPNLKLSSSLPEMASAPSPVQAIFSTNTDFVNSSTIPATEEAQDVGVNQGHIQIAHMEDDVLKQTGATLMTVEEASPEQRMNWGIAESLDPELAAPEGTKAMEPSQSEDTLEQDLNVEITSDVSGTSVPEALSQPVGTVRTQSMSESMAPGEYLSPAWTGSFPTLGVLHACRERATQLEVWLEKAKDSLGVAEKATTASMQASVEQQLLTCQEMLHEIEKEVSSLSVLGQHERSAGSVQEAESLSSKLKLLKTNLVTFQQVLEDRQSQEQIHSSPYTEEQMPSPSLASSRKTTVKRVLQRSVSVQSFSSSKTKLFRQTSLQQQKELEHELGEQRDLTKAIAQQGSRGRLHSQAQEDQAQISPEVPVDVELQGETAVAMKWKSLHKRLLALEETMQNSPSSPALTMTDVSLHLTDRTARSVIGTHSSHDIKTHIRQLRELGQAASDVRTQSVPLEEVHRKLDEGLFEVLSGVALSLSSLTHLLHSHPGQACEETQPQLLQVQTLSEGLVALDKELTAQGSEVISILGSGGSHLCMDHLGKLLPVVQSQLAVRQKQLQHQMEKTGHQQAVERLQEALFLQSSQVASLMQETETEGLPSILIQETAKLEVELENVLSSVEARREELRTSMDLQNQFERLVLGLKGLVTLGSERLSRRPGLEVHSRTELQNYLSRHWKFFQFLGIHLGTLQHLSLRFPEGGLQKSLAGLEEDVAQLQQQALEKGAHMQQILQTWTQWDEEHNHLDTLLRDVEAGLPSMHLEEDTEQQICEKLSVYQKMRGVLDESRARFSQMQAQGRWLQQAGCEGVAVSGRALEARWTGLHSRLEHQLNITDRSWKLSSRLSRDSLALKEWMGGARKCKNSWLIFTLTANQEQDLEDIRSQLKQYMDFTKELEVRSALKASVITMGTQLLQLREAESSPEPCSIENQLRQIELDWTDLLSDIPVVLQTLHQLLMERLSPLGAMTELLAWVVKTEARLEEQRVGAPSLNADLTQLLQSYKECKAEMAVHQLTLDYVTQSAFPMVTERYEHIGYAEELGRLNHHWLSLQGILGNQTQMIEQKLMLSTGRQARLQHYQHWITKQREWMVSAQTPVSLCVAERCLKTCKGLEDSLIRNTSGLQELKGKYLNEKEEGTSVFITQTDDVIKEYTDLTDHNTALIKRLKKVLEVWACFDKRMNDAILITVNTSQAIEYISYPQLSYGALKVVYNKLQLLRRDTVGSDSQWEGLSQSLSLLTDMISLTAVARMAKQLDTEKTRWTEVNGKLNHHLLRTQTLLQFWEAYCRLSVPFTQCLQALSGDVKATMSRPPGQDNTAQLVDAQMQVVHSLQGRTDHLQDDIEGVLKASKELIAQVEPSAAIFLQSEGRMLSRRVLHLRQALADKLGSLQEEHEQLQQFDNVLASLEKHLEAWEERLGRATVLPHVDTSKASLLEISGFSPDLDVLNELSYRLTLSEPAAHRLQTLNRRWAQALVSALDICSEMQMETRKQQSFQEKCENWMDFLQTMEGSLAVDLASTYTDLREQLRTHQRFQSEISIGHQMLHAVINDALHLLQRGDVDDRTDFILKLAQLREHWQGAVQRAAQRRSLVEGMVKHWHLYNCSLKKLQKFVTDTQTLLPTIGLPQSSLQQLRRSVYDLKHTELLFQRYQCSYIQTLELGRQLFATGDEQTQTQLQNDLASLQENWENLPCLIGERKDLVDAIIQNLEHCQTKLANSMHQLDTMQTRLKQSIPEHDNKLQVTEKLIKEADNSLNDWAESLTELATMKTDLSQYIIADDMLLLQEQTEHLHCQWEELCLKVSLRKQEIADRLNAWIIFNEKNKELCDWLTQMENKVVHNADLSIEEMVEKLKKDCMEEINLFSENKTHLKQLGEQLITASNKTKETEVNDKLKDINDRWQHLFDHIEARVRKLKETLVTVQQLDKNMSNLRTWLSRIEAELAKPVVYSTCHSDEIQRKLAEQQDLQRDIEQHTEGVTSVLTLCDVLLHDADACGSDTENDSIQQTTQSLDRRWRNICAMSMERRMRIEETWRLWCKFLDDYSRFEDWLRTAEHTAANPVSADVLYTSAKEELKKFESFQRQVHERLTQLELVNKQYRRLARENRTDAASKLKVMVHEGNQRWDSLQKRVAAILRRLKHFTSQREDFEGTREGLLVWLTEMDLQLTNVEHFSESDIEDKMRQLNGFQQEITLNTNKIDALIVFGENLIQKSAPLDAVLIEDELEELHSYCQEVFGRVARFHHRLINRYPVLEEEKETDLDDSPELASGSRGEIDEEEKEEDECQVVSESLGCQAVSHLLGHPLECSGRETPVSVDSIPLEWDHTVDVGGSSSHEDEEDATFYSAISDVDITESSEAFVKATANALREASVKSVTNPPNWHSPEPQEKKHGPRDIVWVLGSSPSITTSSPYHQQGYVKLLSECSGSIDSVKRVKMILDDEELEDQGLTTLTTADNQTSVIERWELLQAQANCDELCIKQDLQHWQKLNSDLNEVTSWLNHVLPELDRLQRLTPATSVREMEANIRKLKEMQKTFNSYKSVMISINLSGREIQREDSADLQELQESLRTANHSWTQACASLERWEERLHSALIQCQEFQETLHSMLLWLARAEEKRYTIDIQNCFAPRSVLLGHRDTLKALEEELCGRQSQVSSLQEISSQLLVEATAEDSIEAKEKVHVIGNKLRLLLRQVANDLQILQGRLESCPSNSDETDSGGLGNISSQHQMQKDNAEMGSAGVRDAGCRKEADVVDPPARPFFYRVLRAAFPLHLLLLLLLVLSCLVPHSETDYSCTLSNNFARSFYPMLRYTNGPPPT